jgi:hypothetical protein
MDVDRDAAGSTSDQLRPTSVGFAAIFPTSLTFPKHSVVILLSKKVPATQGDGVRANLATGFFGIREALAFLLLND